MKRMKWEEREEWYGMRLTAEPVKFWRITIISVTGSVTTWTVWDGNDPVAHGKTSNIPVAKVRSLWALWQKVPLNLRSVVKNLI